MKLYPPIIKGTIPAFCDGIIKVPFEMNKSVSISQVKGFSLLLKTVQTNTKINDYSQTKWEIKNNIVTLSCGETNLFQFSIIISSASSQLSHGLIFVPS